MYQSLLLNFSLHNPAVKPGPRALIKKFPAYLFFNISFKTSKTETEETFPKLDKIL